MLVLKVFNNIAVLLQYYLNIKMRILIILRDWFDRNIIWLLTAAHTHTHVHTYTHTLISRYIIYIYILINF